MKNLVASTNHIPWGRTSRPTHKVWRPQRVPNCLTEKVEQNSIEAAPTGTEDFCPMELVEVTAMYVPMTVKS